MNDYRRVAIMILVLLIAAPPLNSGLAARSPDFAQLTIVAQSPMADVVVSGLNKADKPITWDAYSPFDAPSDAQSVDADAATTISIDEWWWRFDKTCLGLFSCAATSRISPYVWVRYFDGHIERKRCHLNDPAVEQSGQWVTCEFSYVADLGENVPDEYTVDQYADGLTLYTDAEQTLFMQVVNLAGAGAITMRAGPVVDPPTPEESRPSLARQTINQAWRSFSASTESPFCLSNGQFFSIRDPSYLSFGVKSDGEIISVGAVGEEFPGEQLMLEIWPERAVISPFSAEAFLESTAPNVIVGLTETADKVKNLSVPRTFVGTKDTDGDGLYETVLILTISAADQAYAADKLREFGAAQVMMLDGGGSTQLVCRDELKLASPEIRFIPQTIGTYTQGDIRLTTSVRSDILVEANDTVTFPVYVPAGQSPVSFSTAHPANTTVMSLESPSGIMYKPGSLVNNTIYEHEPTYEQYTIIDPEPGEWTVTLAGSDTDQTVRFTFDTGLEPIVTIDLPVFGGSQIE